MLMNTEKGKQYYVKIQKMTMLIYEYRKRSGQVDKTVKDSSNFPLLKKFQFPGMAVSSPVVAACMVDIGEHFIAISAKILC